jgi:hypothetical protein
LLDERKVELPLRPLPRHRNRERACARLHHPLSP